MGLDRMVCLSWWIKWGEEFEGRGERRDKEERRKGNRKTVIREVVVLVPTVPVFDLQSPVRSG